MKALTRIDVPSKYRSGYVHGAGTEVCLVEKLDEATSTWLVEFRVPDEALVGGAWYEHFSLNTTQMDVVEERVSKRESNALSPRVDMDALRLTNEGQLVFVAKIAIRPGGLRPFPVRAIHAYDLHIMSEKGEKIHPLESGAVSSGTPVSLGHTEAL